MARIAILSLPLLDNYGGILQAYALVQVLRQEGHEVVYLQRESNKPFHRKVIDGVKARMEAWGLGRLAYYIEEKRNNHGLFAKTLPFRTFVKRHIGPLSPTFYTSAQMTRYCRRHPFDVYIVGSDQIWRRDFVPSVSDAFLQFVPAGGRKVSYAASLGADHWAYTPAETQMIQSALSAFRAVSVREASAARLLEACLRLPRPVQVTLDPTLLLPAAHYETLFSDIPRRHGVLYYLFAEDDVARQLLSCLQAATGWPSFTVFSAAIYGNDVHASRGFSVEGWLAGFRHADCVLTDSFHGVVFSILFQRPFWVLGNAMRGTTRICDLLQRFGLTDRLLSAADAASGAVDWLRPIDWASVNRLREAEAARSLAFLHEAVAQP